MRQCFTADFKSEVPYADSVQLLAHLLVLVCIALLLVQMQETMLSYRGTERIYKKYIQREKYSLTISYVCINYVYVGHYFLALNLITFSAERIL